MKLPMNINNNIRINVVEGLEMSTVRQLSHLHNTEMPLSYFCRFSHFLVI